MLKKCTVFFTFICMMLTCVLQILPVNKVFAENQAIYYISPSGSDTTGDGSIDNPWMTIQKAQNVVRTINGDMTGDIYVYLRGGDYFIDSTINFGPADSGTNGHKIYYSGYPGDAMPRIIGGKALTGWTLDSGNIYKTYVGTSWTFNRLYENDVPGVMARYPNTGFINTAGTGPMS